MAGHIPPGCGKVNRRAQRRRAPRCGRRPEYPLPHGKPTVPLAFPHVSPDLGIYVLQYAPTQGISLGAALIYITAALWDFQDSLSRTNRFLGHLFAIVRETRLDRDPACESLLRAFGKKRVIWISETRSEHGSPRSSWTLASSFRWHCSASSPRRS